MEELPGERAGSRRYYNDGYIDHLDSRTDLFETYRCDIRGGMRCRGMVRVEGVDPCEKSHVRSYVRSHVRCHMRTDMSSLVQSGTKTSHEISREISHEISHKISHEISHKNQIKKN